MPSAVEDYMDATAFRAWMQEHGWTVTRLAATSIASRSMLHRYLAGTHPITPQFKMALVGANLEVPRKERAS